MRTNWGGNLTFQHAQTVAPDCAEAVADMVRAHERVKAIGTAHSFSAVADSPGVAISTERLDFVGPVQVLGTDEATVRIGAGVTYARLAPELHRQGWALNNLASLTQISVAGATATGTHGSGVRNQTLSAAVTGLEWVDGTGAYRTCLRGDSLFEGCVVHLGALGVVTALTLALRPAVPMRQVVYEGLTFDRLVEEYADILGCGESVSVFLSWWPDQPARVWWKGSEDRRPELDLPIAPGPMHPVPGQSPEPCTEQGDALGPWYERLPHFRADRVPSVGEEMQSEYFVPSALAPDALRALTELDSDIASALFISELRTVAGDSLWLSPAYGGDVAAIHFTWRSEPDLVRPLLPRIEAVLAPFSPRPHWGKLFSMGRAEISAAYQRYEDFRQLRAQLDPLRKFDNAYLSRLFG
jgi:xylitol oxidase